MNDQEREVEQEVTGPDKPKSRGIMQSLLSVFGISGFAAAKKGGELAKSEAVESLGKAKDEAVARAKDAVASESKGSGE